MWRGQTGLSRDDAFSCFVCGKTFDGIVDLMVHKRREHEPGPAEHAALAEQEIVRKQRQATLREKHEEMQREHEAKLEEKRRRRKTTERPKARGANEPTTFAEGQSGPSRGKKKQRKAPKGPERTQKLSDAPPKKLRRLRRPS